LWQGVYRIQDKSLNQFKEKFNLEPGICYIKLGTNKAYQVMYLRRDNTFYFVFGGTVGDHHLSAAQQARNFLDNSEYFSNQHIGSGGLVSVRRALDTMVSDGFLCLGDAACQSVPTTGHGISSGFFAAEIAANSIADAINTSDFSARMLWNYNYEYQKSRGAILGSFDIIRLFLQELPIELTNELITSQILNDNDLVAFFTSNKIVYNVHQMLDNFKRMLRSLNSFSISLQFLHALNDSERIFKLYHSYPEFMDLKKLETWQSECHTIFDPYYDKLTEDKSY
jgi:hypothetical protein